MAITKRTKANTGFLFKAGFARVDITPSLGTPIVGYFEERRAKGILDNLEANVLAVSDGERTAVLLAADLLGIAGVAFNAAVRRRIAATAGVAEDAVYIHATHTHTGPGAGKAGAGRTDLFDGTDFYNEFLSARLADVARLAVDDLAPRHARDRPRGGEAYLLPPALPHEGRFHPHQSWCRQPRHC